MDRFEEIIIAIIVAIILDVLCAVLLMWCWNYIAPTVFGLPMIDWWQAFVMELGAGLLFRSTPSSSK